jgi:hypothetical protein
MVNVQFKNFIDLKTGVERFKDRANQLKSYIGKWDTTHNRIQIELLKQDLSNIYDSLSDLEKNEIKEIYSKDDSIHIEHIKIVFTYNEQ